MSEKTITIGAAEHGVTVLREQGGWVVRLAGGSETRIEVIAVRDGEADVRIDGTRRLVPFRVDGDRVELALEGEILRAEVVPHGGRRRSRQADHSLGAPMPGQVLKIFVEVGDRVEKGDALLVLEAMKMEHQIVAPGAGLVESIACAVGELVQPGVDLITIAPEES